MYKMTDEEFYKVYGRMPRRSGRNKKKKVKVYWHRIIIALLILALAVFGIVKLISFIVGKVKAARRIATVRMQLRSTAVMITTPHPKIKKKTLLIRISN